MCPRCFHLSWEKTVLSVSMRSPAKIRLSISRRYPPICWSSGSPLSVNSCSSLPGENFMSKKKLSSGNGPFATSMIPMVLPGWISALRPIRLTLIVIQPSAGNPIWKNTVRKMLLSSIKPFTIPQTPSVSWSAIPPWKRPGDWLKFTFNGIRQVGGPLKR